MHPLSMTDQLYQEPVYINIVRCLSLPDLSRLTRVNRRFQEISRAGYIWHLWFTEFNIDDKLWDSIQRAKQIPQNRMLEILENINNLVDEAGQDLSARVLATRPKISGIITDGPYFIIACDNKETADHFEQEFKEFFKYRGWSFRLAYAYLDQS